MPQIDLGQVVGPQGAQGEPGPQGAQGIQGPAGPAATINGVNALTIEAGDNIELSQSDSTTTLSVPTDAAPTEDSTKPVQSGGVAAALSNKAPAGFGLGGYVTTAPVNLDSLSDADLIVKTGFYQAVANAPQGGNSWRYILHLSRNADNAWQLSEDINFAGLAVRIKKEGIWEPWEWINPPMQLGVEYRTTERYGGSPVYVKAVDCGQIADGKEVQHGIADINIVIRYQGMRTGFAIPQVYNKNLGDPWSAYVASVNKTRISLSCGESASGGNCTVILWYTKTTN